MDELPAQEIPFSLSDNESVTEQTLRGEVEKVLYENEENSYAVLIVRDAAGELHNAVCRESPPDRESKRSAAGSSTRSMDGVSGLNRAISLFR